MANDITGVIYARFTLPGRVIAARDVTVHRPETPGVSQNQHGLNVLSGLLESGMVKPMLDRSYPLSGVADALRYVERCHARGKVTITVNTLV
jgi:NADPH:quinone reductase-like Zn-dependent oxidoreductase